MEHQKHLCGWLPSDVYFVENALENEVFGKDFDAGWGPLDSSVVKENLKVKTSPYDTRPNYGEKWSDGTATGTEISFSEGLIDHQTCLLLAI